MKKKVLNSLFDLKFDSRLFIEASAGTGKTYTIVGLYLRLLIEKKLETDQILVMTFTKKATAELRERIFARLRETLHYLRTGETEDSGFMIDLEKSIAGQDRNLLIRHLSESIRNFDESQIYTIHSFCQKILREEALLAGTPFEVEITQHDGLLLEAAEDEWRLFMARYQSDEPGRYLIRKLLDLANTPAELVDKLGPLFSRSYADHEGQGSSDPIGFLNELIRQRRAISSCWNREKGEINRILNECPVSRFQQFLGGRRKKLIRFLEDEEFMSDAPDDDVLRFFRADYLYDENNIPKKNKGERTEEHRFFELCQEYHDLISEIGQVSTFLIQQLYGSIGKRRASLSDGSKTLTYDDLLQKVAGTLSDPDHGKELASVIRKKVPYALVDEFQDTDPVQYQIFDSIYPESDDDCGLLMIGDPKQAIYAFRGADIYTYLKARKQCKGESYALKKNYRSSQELIEAVNALFEGDHDPFLEREIPFIPSESGVAEHSNGLLIHGKQPEPLRISLNDTFFTNKDEALSFSVGETVAQIVRLLNLSKDGNATIEERALKASDICVLVNSHKDGAAIKRALKRAGVGAVTYSREQVFESFEAVRLNLAMIAILEPQNSRQVRAALLNGFFGLSLRSIDRILGDESAFQGFVEELQSLNEIWHQSGFYPMFRALLYQNERLSNLAGLEFSERILTNLLQLADICSKAEAEGKLSPQALHSWFQRQMTDPGQDDEKTLLLESDQNLVKISTIHSSKGLEFPIVFVLTPWAGLSSSGGSSKRLFKIYNDRDSGRTVINIDQTDSDERREAAERNKFESLADEVRKFYVALTRAKYQCTLCWATHSNSHFSGLGAAILGREKAIQLIGASRNTISEKDDLNQDYFGQFFSNHALANPDLMALDVKSEAQTDTKTLKYNLETDEPMNLRPYNGRKELPVQKKLESFSSLVHHKSEPGEPDYDQMVQSYADALGSDPAPVHERNIFTFPKGATAGSAIHKIFEHEQFDFSKATVRGDEEWIAETLGQFRIDPEWSAVIRKMLNDASGAVIPGMKLNDVGIKDQLREMEFHFGSSAVPSDQLFKIIREDDNGVDDGYPEPDRVGTGYMTGFIDLIIRQNGKFYILDYKSNYLGDSLSDYNVSHLEKEILKAGYDLQAHIYMVALVKYLEKRLPEFSYEKHIGGAVYLFVRGVKEGTENGVWFKKPDVQLIRKLEKILSRKEKGKGSQNDD